jgi:transcriptional regulator with XRE-family HTH domain
VSKKRQIGTRVRAYRLERHLTQEQLAEKIDRSVETVSNLERGISLPNEATLRRLARSLDVSFEDLLVERSAPDSLARPIEFYRATELLKVMDPKKLKLAYNVLKAIVDS